MLRKASLKMIALWGTLVLVASTPQSKADGPDSIEPTVSEERGRWLSQPSRLSLGEFTDTKGRHAHDRVPGMIGDYFSGVPRHVTGRFELDRLFAIADDLDSPGTLPSSGALLTITESGPVGIFSSSLGSVLDLQQILRSGGSLPVATLEGQIADSATMTTLETVGEIQTLLASTVEAFDIVSLASPPGAYQTTVDAVFATRNSTAGTTLFEQSDSGALLQAGVDTLSGGEDFDAFYFFSYGVDLDLPVPGVGSGATGVEKLAQGSSVFPRDRVFFNYGYFDDTRLAAGGVSYNRFTPGFEKTVFDGQGSIEFRLPFASTVDNPINANGATGTGDVRFGNLQVYLKYLLGSHDWMAFSGGLGISIPTERDLLVQLSDGTPLVTIENEAIHLQPFLAAALTPDDRFFAQAILQFDFDANGNPVAINQTGVGLARSGTLQNASMLYVDISTGYWIIQGSPSSSHWLSALAGIFEIHHNQSLSGQDSVSQGGLSISAQSGSVSETNLVVGAIAEIAGNSNLSLGYVVPVSSDSSRQFDGALRATVDWRFR